MKQAERSDSTDCHQCAGRKRPYGDSAVCYRRMEPWLAIDAWKGKH